MPNVAVIGAQWGDEGKGKIVDLLARRADIVVRFQGGNNAGHTVVVNGQTTILHIIPSGALHTGKTCVIGNGVVFDAAVLLDELKGLRANGHLEQESQLKISEEAHLIMPYHKAIDQARERLRGAGKIGTTGRGIGPAYEDKAARVGIRLIDLMEPDTFREKLEHNIREKNIYLKAILKEKTLDFQAIHDAFSVYRDQLAPHVANTGVFLEESTRQGKHILFEGAQGTLLDVDHGTYPFVTSSNTVIGGVCTGAGIGPRRIHEVIGISKAYATRVGSGPFPTELNDAEGRRLLEEGQEFGATTGRARRCGWFDTVAVRHAVRLNGLTGIVLTKLDVLTGFRKIKVCTAYRSRGHRLLEFPASTKVIESVEPVWEEFEGWTEPLSEARNIQELPANARRYMHRLEELVETEIILASIGPDRDQTIMIRDPFSEQDEGPGDQH